MLSLAQPVNRAAPPDWSEFDAADWASAIPRGTFINAQECQGMRQTGFDGYHQREADGATILTGICDDTKDWPAGMRWAEVITIRPLRVHPDPLLNGQITTHHEIVRYAEPDAMAELERGSVEVRPWSEFTYPPQDEIRAGQWLTDAQFEAHTQALTRRTWREWTDGLPASQLGPDGRVRDQRRRGAYKVPDGTRTYYVTSTAEASVHTAVQELAMALAPPGGPTTLNITGVGTNGQESINTQTPANEPNQAGAWGTISIRYQIDIPFKDSTTEINATDMGSANGHFARVDSGLTSDLETHQATSPNILSPGLHLISCVVTWVLVGAATDRAAILVNSQKVFGHGKDSWGVDVDESDDFFDGGWPAAAVGAQADTASSATVALAAQALAIGPLQPELCFDGEVATSHEMDGEVATSHEMDGEIATEHTFDGEV